MSGVAGALLRRGSGEDVQVSEHRHGKEEAGGPVGPKW
jgi:hypothetical protein